MLFPVACLLFPESQYVQVLGLHKGTAHYAGKAHASVHISIAQGSIAIRQSSTQIAFHEYALKG